MGLNPLAVRCIELIQVQKQIILFDTSGSWCLPGVALAAISFRPALSLPGPSTSAPHHS